MKWPARKTRLLISTFGAGEEAEKCNCIMTKLLSISRTLAARKESSEHWSSQRLLRWAHGCWLCWPIPRKWSRKLSKKSAHHRSARECNLFMLRLLNGLCLNGEAPLPCIWLKSPKLAKAGKSVSGSNSWNYGLREAINGGQWDQDGVLICGGTTGEALLSRKSKRNQPDGVLLNGEANGLLWLWKALCGISLLNGK